MTGQQFFTCTRSSLVGNYDSQLVERGSHKPPEVSLIRFVDPVFKRDFKDSYPGISS